MARLARVVAPGFPHHITQRGNRRQETFFSDNDYRTYITLMAECCQRCGVEIWAYCLMPNHVHLAAVPESEEGLRRSTCQGVTLEEYSGRLARFSFGSCFCSRSGAPATWIHATSEPAFAQGFGGSPRHSSLQQAAGYPGEGEWTSDGVIFDWQYNTKSHILHSSKREFLST